MPGQVRHGKTMQFTSILALRANRIKGSEIQFTFNQRYTCQGVVDLFVIHLFICEVNEKWIK